MHCLKLIGVGALALGVSLQASAATNEATVVAKIESGLSQAQRAADHHQDVTAVKALLAAGVAPANCVKIVKSALAHNVPPADIAKLSRRIEARAHGDREKAEQYAKHDFANAETHYAAAGRLRSDVGGSAQGGGMGGGSFGGGSGMGGGSFGGGSGMGGGMGGR